MNASLKALGLGLTAMVGVMGMAAIARADQPLKVVYPPDGHETTAAQIFLIGSAAPNGEVTVNGQPIQRSAAGYFAPSFPLQPGENHFTVRYGDQEVVLRVVRVSAQPVVPTGAAFGEGSLVPAVDIARMPEELVCFGAIAPENAQVFVNIGIRRIALMPHANPVELPPNSAVLTGQNQPEAATTNSYQGCAVAQNLVGDEFYTTSNLGMDLGYPRFELSFNGQTVTQQGLGRVGILIPTARPVVAVTAEAGTARTGPSTDYSRLTPLPKGTQATVTGVEGDWLRLDYGAWIRASETQRLTTTLPPRSLIRSIRADQVDGWTEITFPLQVPVPVAVQQGDRTFTLTLYNTTAQTDIIRLSDDPIIERLDWQQVAPTQVQYTFNLKSSQQWGYKLRYEGSNLVLALRHPPHLASRGLPLSGVTVLLDPGHGGPEDLGSVGPTGYPEKDVALIVSKLVRDRLQAQGATVLMTREEDIDLYPNDRAAMIEQQQPTLSLSLHYNALPDDGDAMQTAGVSTYWYQTQSHSLAMFLHNYLTQTLDRPSYGVFWDNLALTRPAVAPAVLLELGFMINPEEFEWITDSQAQEQLADAIVEGITRWVRSQE